MDLLDQGVQRAGVLSAIPSILKGFGIEPADLLESAGLDAHVLDDPDNLITYLAMDRFLGKCVARTKCNHFGLLVGQRGDTSVLGIVGGLMRNAPNVGCALQDLVRNHHRYSRGSAVYLILQGDVFVFGYAIYQNSVKMAPHILDGEMALAFNIMQEISGELPLEVLLSHARTAKAGPYQECFKVPVLFDAELTGLVYPQRILNRKIAQADATLYAILEAEVESYWAVEKPSLANLVRRELSVRIATGDTGLAALARRYSMHPRMFKRQLAAEGVAFRDLLQDAKFQFACLLLENSRLNVTNIALALGYSEPSVFSRSFRRWSGSSPANWRAALSASF